MSDQFAVRVDDVSKRYRLYHERNDTLKSMVMRGRRARYDDLWALRDISFEIEHGETFALIGENGSGKSTLLKCIARILTPDEGTIETRGKISALLELGAGFHPELSGRDNVFLNGSILGLSKKQIEARFDDIVAFAGLERFIDTAVKNYSSGMYIRLGFAIAINVEPDILLVDEVLAVGDAEFQHKCLEKVDELKAQGRTIIIVTHALGSVRNLCDRALLLEDGQMKRLGPTADVIDQYLDGVFTDRIRDGEHGMRWGTGEIHIDDVEILDGADERSKRISTGDTVTFRIHWTAASPVERPVFGLAIHRIDGIEVSGQNTRDAGILLGAVHGQGHLDFRVERLMLTPGTYDLSGWVSNFTQAHIYDQRHRTFRFDVEAGDPYASFGIFALEGAWNGPIADG